MHDPLRSLPFTGPYRRGLILAALSALGLALTALLILLPNRTTFAATVDVGVTQTSSTTSPVVGALLTYTVVVTNGSTPTDGPVLFTNTLPANVTLASVSTTQGTCPPETQVTCTITPTMTANSAVTVTLAVTPTAAGAASNQAVISVTGADTDTFAGNDSTTLPLTVGPGASTTTITSDNPDPSVVGQAITVNFSVAGPGVTPSGSVTITVTGGTETCTGTLNASGAGSCLLTLNSAGARTLTASYSGDANYLASSDTEPHTVNAAASTTTITSDNPDPSVVGQAITVNFSVAGPGVIPSGSVTITVTGGTETCTGTLTAGAGSCLLTLNSAGARTLTASYSGDANYLASSDTEPHTVNAAASTTTITSDNPDPSVVGQAVTVNFSVAGPGVTPSGSVTITVTGGTETCTGTLNASGAGSCLLTLNSAGARTLTASYSGDANYLASSDTEPHTVNAAASTTTITSDNPDPSVVGQAITVNFSVAGPGVTPSGSVTITVTGGTETCTGTLNASGAGSCLLTLNSAGARTLTASYSGDANYLASSDTEPHTVNAAASTTTITSDNPDPSVVGQAITVNFSVAGPGVIPSGSVTITVTGGTETCTGTLTAGAGSCLLTLNSAGARTLTASYSGDANYLASSDTEPHTVNAAASTTTITSDNPDPSVVGQAVTVNFSVAGPGVIPSGSVTITVTGGTETCTGTLTAGAGSCLLTLNSAGARTLTASYGGDANYFASSDTELHAVNPASTTTTLVTSGTPSVFGQAVTFTATVAAQAPGSGTPSGNVTFFVNGAPVFTPTLSVSGQAAYFTSTLAVGTHAITATYGGSGNYNVSTSGTLTQTVNPANVTVQFGAFNPTSSVVGQPVNVPVTVTAAAPGSGTPTGVVTVTASLSENCTVTLSGGSGSCNLTLTAAGTRTLTASYGGDPNFNTGTATTNYIVNRANTNTIITSAVPPQPTLGQTLAVSYSVSVVAPGAGSPAGNVTVSAGSDSCTATVAAGSCTLTFRDPPGTGNRTLTAVYAGNSNFNGSTSAAIPITVTLPTVQFSAATYSVNEDTGGSSPAPVTATITATLSNPSIYTITVNYATSNGSAVAGSDYLTATGVLTFTPGQTQRSFNVTTNADDLAEGDETITLTLSSPTANRAALGAPNPATLVIADNEGTPTLRFSESTATVNEVAGSLKIFVTLSTPAQDTVTVTVTSVNGTAVAGQDFDAVSRTLTFMPGTTAQDFDVTIHNDNIYELDEVFTLTLGSTSNNATISAFLKTQTVTIQSDDAPPSVHFGFPTYAFAEGSGAVTIAVTLSRPSALPAQVNYATSNGTALAGVDYQPASGTLTFAPLVTTGTFTVTLLDDLVAEDYKDLYLTLSNPVVATASGAGMNAKLTIANDDARAGCMIFPSNDVPKIIPDNTPAGITSTLTLPGPGFVITDVSVRINSLQHVFLGDLQISLVAPDGRSVPLLNNVGDKPNLLYTVFNDLGASIVGNQPPFTGVFRPNTMLPALRRLNGSLSGGVWGLRIVDDRFPDPELEQLNSWGLELCGTVTMTHVVYLPLVRR